MVGKRKKGIGDSQVAPMSWNEIKSFLPDCQPKFNNLNEPTIAYRTCNKINET